MTTDDLIFSCSVYQNPCCNVNYFYSIGGLRHVEAREKMVFSRTFNEVVLGFLPEKGSMGGPVKLHDDMTKLQDTTSVSSTVHKEYCQDSPNTPSTQSAPGQSSRASLGGIQLSPILLRSMLMKTDGVLQKMQENPSLDFQFIAERLKVAAIRPLQRSALMLLMDANTLDTKIIQGPTSMGKDLLPFAMAVATGKAQLMFVPYVALIDNAMKEGSKFGCKVVKLADIGRSIDIATAAATADIIICSYEHAVRAIRVAQELLTRQRLGWCFWNEAHVISLDGDFRDFSTLNELSAHCAQVCCMTATLQPQHLTTLASKLGRNDFSTSMFVPPNRPGLVMLLKLTTDSKSWIVQQLKAQPKHQKAIVFCLFKKVVSEMAKCLRVELQNRKVLECTSGALADLPTFRTLDSTVMVCTSVLSAGVSIDNITRVYFLDCVQGPEALIQGAGRGARAEADECVAALVTTKSSLQYFQQAKLSGISEMATFCQKCIDEALNFSHEVYKLFEHPLSDQVSNRLKRRKLDSDGFNVDESAHEAPSVQAGKHQVLY